MKRYILIARLTVSVTGRGLYTIKIDLRGKETYSMSTRSKRLYNKLIRELSNLSGEADYDFLLRVARKVLEWNDVFYDELEFL